VLRLVVHQRFDQRALCSPTLKFDNLLGVNFFFQPKGRRAALLPTLRVLLAVSQTISHEITWLSRFAHFFRSFEDFNLLNLRDLCDFPIFEES
jgi:hypothetical protein